MLHVFIFNSEVDIEEYDFIRMDPRRRDGGIANYDGKTISYNHSSRLCCNTENIFRDIFFVTATTFELTTT